MTVIVSKSVLTGLTVKDAMRRQIIRLPQTATIDHSINHLIKYKANALLTVDSTGHPAGVVSKTDIVGAYYADLPIDSALQDIMVAPPLLCKMGDSLEAALDVMRNHRVYRLYVTENDTEEVVGALAYPDMVGLLYRYCHTCNQSLQNKGGAKVAHQGIIRLKVKDVMTENVVALVENDSISSVMEQLSAYRFGAVLIENDEKRSVGVVSKTDLILAYKHKVSADEAAREVMTSPVKACDEKDYLEDAIQVMIFSEVHRIFVQRDEPQQVIGVLSLSDAARVRSGSCQACVSSRIEI